MSVPWTDGARGLAALAVVLAWLALCVVCWRSRRTPSIASDDVAFDVVHASQTGHAVQIAERTAEALRSAGARVALRALGEVDIASLAGPAHRLFVVSTTGEGDAPDAALAFVRDAMATSPDLSGLQYAILALGDRAYRHHCAFGHALDDWLRERGATASCDLIEVDNADQGALHRWQQQLATLAHDARAADWVVPADASWRLVARTLENPRSVGGAAWRVRLEPPAGTPMPAWQAGDIAEVGPGATRDDADTVDAADEPVAPGRRDYSIASLPIDGGIELLVRLMHTPDGRAGVASGWLAIHAPIGASIDLRIRPNPQFHAPDDDRPLVLIGNGTGIAGLRALLKERESRGHTRNWLLFGERNADRDAFFGEDIERWRRSGLLEHVDHAWSRDGIEPVYVQHRLAESIARLERWLERGAAIYVCGSLHGMAEGVDTTLRTWLGAERLASLAIDGRYRRDVY